MSATPGAKSTNAPRHILIYGPPAAEYDLDTPMNPTDLSIDNAEIAPDEVASQIARYVGLAAPS